MLLLIQRQRKVPSDEEEQQLKVGAHIVAPVSLTQIIF